MTKSKNHTVNGTQTANTRLFIIYLDVVLLLNVLSFSVNRLSCDTEIFFRPKESKLYHSGM